MTMCVNECMPTQSEASKHWPEGTISARVTVNPYVYALAVEEAFKQGMKPWEYVMVALWEKLGKPDEQTLLEFAAHMEIDEEDPKWLKRLRLTARHELETRRAVQAAAEEEGDNGSQQH